MKDKKHRGVRAATSTLLSLVMAATLLGTMPSQALAASVDEQVFRLTIQIPADGFAFIIPTSGALNGLDTAKPFNWNIDWGNGFVGTEFGVSSENGGVGSSYLKAGVYTITITPNGSTEAWLAAFGFGNSLAGSGANDPANKDMLVGVPCALTPEMTRTDAQITGQVAPPDFEWSMAFQLCGNLVQAPTFAGWENITSVGNYFARCMFLGCSALQQLPDGFNLPQNITSTGSEFAYSMFYMCTNLVSLPKNFSLPHKITSISDSFAYGMFYYCRNLEALPAGFNFPQGITDAKDFFAAGMFYDCTRLKNLPSGLNLPSALISVGSNFGLYLFASCQSLEYLPDGFNLPKNITSVGISFGDQMFTNCRILKALPDGFSIPQGITIAPGNFLYGMFMDCYSLESLPEGFNLSQGITAVDDGFAYVMFRSCRSLIALPEGFNLPQGIRTAGDSFAMGMFGNCFNLTALPSGFNLPQQMTSVGNSFTVSMFDSCSSLTTLPQGFSLPSNITTAGYNFASNMFHNAGSSTFQINDEFRLPVGLAADCTGAFGGVFQLSPDAPVQLRSAASIIGGCPTPADARYTFDSHFSDLPYIPVNWGGGGLPRVGAPGSGDLDGDGFVTMGEVSICALAAIGSADLSPAQLDAIDIDRDGVITMADVMSIYKLAIM